jgi:hypothetical protein
MWRESSRCLRPQVADQGLGQRIDRRGPYGLGPVLGGHKTGAANSSRTISLHVSTEPGERVIESDPRTIWFDIDESAPNPERLSERAKRIVREFRVIKGAIVRR